MKAKKTSREFHSLTHGFIHEKSGDEKNTIAFDTKKIAPRVFQVILPDNLPPGEYGFLPPETQQSGGSIGSHGKMYTFSISK